MLYKEKDTFKRRDVLTAFFVGAAGTTMRGTAVYRIATTTTRRTGTTTAGCAFL